MRPKRVAIIHDWLTGMRGGERCLEEFLAIYPAADIYTMIHVPGSTSEIIDKNVKGASFLQKLPGVKYYYRWLLPLYPLAMRSIRLKNYDLVVSLSHAGAKNVKIPTTAKHVCYLFTPMRYIWDQSERYFGKMRYLIWPIVKFLRSWDIKGANGVDQFVVISNFVAARVRCFYKRESIVVYPPINQYWMQQENSERNRQYFLYAGALVSYKNVSQIIEAFNQLDDELLIVGDGPQRAELEKIANKNIKFIGRVPDSKLYRYYKNAKALVFAAKEDFGLIPIESLACGTPVIAGFAGALRESLSGLKYWENDKLAESKPTGVFFRLGNTVLVDEIVKGVKYFKKHENLFSSQVCKEHANKFSLQVFREKWFKVEDVLYRKKPKLEAVKKPRLVENITK